MSVRPKGHVVDSRGADTDPRSPYSTIYSTTYGRHFSKSEQRPWRHTDPGYLTNFPHGVYFNAGWDQVDNPSMGRLLSDNYESGTKKSPNGSAPLPDQPSQASSDLSPPNPATIPTQSQGHGVGTETREALAPVDNTPRDKPHLRKIQSDDPVELENGGYDPGYMTTGFRQHFQGNQPGRSDVSRTCVGKRQETGWTRASSQEPITFQPRYAFGRDVSGFQTERATGESTMAADFGYPAYPKGDEPLPRLIDRANRYSGYTAGTRPRHVLVHRSRGDTYDKASNTAAAWLERIRKTEPTEYIPTVQPNSHYRQKRLG